MSVFVISDTHWMHFNIIRYCNRPFANVDEMDRAMKENWNAVVQPSDTVYHLGDFGFGNPLILYEKFFKNLNGEKFLIPGNHDHQFHNYLLKTMGEKYDKILPPIYNLHYNGTLIVLCHYPLASWEQRERGSLSCFGHVHNSFRLEDMPNRFNVCVENIGYMPINVERLLEKKDK